MFVMIIVSLVIIAMSRLASVQHGSNALAIQQARAYQAARAGLEWGISQSANAGLCASGSPSLADSGLSEFTVGVVCVASNYTDADGTLIQIFRFTATAQNGNPGARADYAFRRLTAVVER
jgi:MSHA biogenesis protein MshP